MKTKLAFCNAHVNYEYIADLVLFANSGSGVLVTLLDATHQKGCVLRKTRNLSVCLRYYSHYLELHHCPPTDNVQLFCTIPKEYVRF